MERSVSSGFSTALIICLTFTGFSGANVWPCDRATFDNEVHSQCLALYKQRMASSNYQEECPWPSTECHYAHLDACMEMAANLTGCTNPALKNEFFLELHQTYYSLCFFMQDPDVPMLLLLVLPCTLTTFLFPFFCTHLISATS